LTFQQAETEGNLAKNQLKGGIFILRRINTALNGRQYDLDHCPQAKGALSLDQTYIGARDSILGA